MDTTKLKTFIADPSHISKDDLAEFEQSLAKYPFCSSLHILYLKALSNSNSIHFDEALRKSSIQVNDREQLFTIINTKVNSEQELSKKSEVTLPTKAKEVTTKDIKEEIQPKPLKNKFEVQEDAKIEIPNSKEESIKGPTSLETDILNSAIDSALIFDVENIDKSNDNSNTRSPKKLIDISTKGIELEFSKESILNDLTPDSTDKSPDNFNSDIDLKNLSFSEWLLYKKTSQHHKKVALKKEETIQTLAPKAKSEEELIPDPKLTKKEINYLLDKFIEEEPRLSKPKKDFYNPLDNAKKSLDDTDILVSETLAKIYHLQKNYTKAIKAYEQLSLLNPKKKSFFANQIKKIKKDELK